MDTMSDALYNAIGGGCDGGIPVEAYSHWQGGHTGYGWTCPTCFKFIPHDESHDCPVSTTEQFKSSVPTPPTERRIADALERIATVMERSFDE